MATHELIKKLTKDLKPVKPLEPVGRRWVRWTGFGALVLLVGFSITGVRENLAERFSSPGFLFETLALLTIAMMAALAALVFSVPGRTMKWVSQVLIVLVGFWVGHQLFLLGEHYAAVGRSAFNPGTDAVCSGLIFMAGGALVYPLFRILRQALPLNPTLCGALAGLANASFAAFGMQFICVNDHPAHVFVWHIGAVVLFVLGGLFLGRRTLDRARRIKETNGFI